MKPELADFGGGCFWGVEEVFRMVHGVTKTTVGYEGGHVDNPTYEQVTTHTTGHAETVQIEFDPNEVSYERLLEIFFMHIDPTQLDSADTVNVGENYRSVIFYHNDAQKKAAEEMIKKLQEKAHRKIVTEVVAAQTFWHAEEYHQKYLLKRNLGVCT
jgi:peptide-methionine (S)-S-oxide reductase